MRARLIATRGAEAANRLRVHTKLVPDLSILPDNRTTRCRSDHRPFASPAEDASGSISCSSIGGTMLSRAGSTRCAGLTICGQRARCGLSAARILTPSHVRAIIEAGIPLASMQVQYSVLDRRPENGLAALCRAHGVGLICYGSVAGGFLSDRWLGQPEPAQPLANRSLVKYKLIIDDFGGWTLFQELAARAPPRRRPARRRHRQRREPVRARSSRRRCGDCRRDLARASCRQCRGRRARADRRGPGGDRGRRAQSAEDRKATSTNSSATATGGTARS